MKTVRSSYEIFQSFDDVLLLGAGGRVVYLGESSGALDYFTRLGFTCPDRMNPADFFMDVIAGKFPRVMPSLTKIFPDRIRRRRRLTIPFIPSFIDHVSR